jgi:hypothetical protein
MANNPSAGQAQAVGAAFPPANLSLHVLVMRARSAVVDR